MHDSVCDCVALWVQRYLPDPYAITCMLLHGSWLARRASPVQPCAAITADRCAVHMVFK